MTYNDIALYSALSLCAGLLVGIAWGGISSFTRALLS